MTPSVAPLASPPRVALRAPGARVVAFRVAFAAGSADDPAGKEGLTRLAASLVVEGGTVDLSYAEMEKRLYPTAASIDVSVDRDETVFSATVPAGSLDRFYPLLRDVLLAPRFDAESFARLRSRQASELTSGLRGEDDEELGKEALQAILYRGHPYGHPVAGTERGLAASTLDDVRAQWARAFCKERVLVGVAGAYPERFDETVAGDLAKLPACAGERAGLPDPPPRDGNQLLVVDKPAAGATAISIGFTTPVTRSDSAEFPGLVFATDALGIHRQAAGLLYRELRARRGLNYGDYVYAEFFGRDPSGVAAEAEPNVARRQQLVSLWLRPVRHANAPFALRAALYVYSKFVHDGVSDADFSRMRELLVRQVGLGEQTQSRRLGFAMDDRAYGQEKPYAEMLRAGWADLDPGKLKTLAAKLLDTRNLAIAVVSSDGQALATELSSPADRRSCRSTTRSKPPEVQAEDKEIAALPLPFDAKGIQVVPVGEMFR